MNRVPKTDLVVSWDESFRVGVKSIDDQHKFLVDLIAKLQSAMASGTARTILVELIADLILYTKYHFAWEEQILEQHAYPELETHRAQHADLTRQVLELQAQLESSRLKIGSPVLVFLRHWLLDHICGSDRLFGPYLNSRSVT